MVFIFVKIEGSNSSTKGAGNAFERFQWKKKRKRVGAAVKIYSGIMTRP